MHKNMVILTKTIPNSRKFPQTVFVHLDLFSWLPTSFSFLLGPLKKETPVPLKPYKPQGVHIGSWTIKEKKNMKLWPMSKSFLFISCQIPRHWVSKCVKYFGTTWLELLILPTLLVCTIHAIWYVSLFGFIRWSTEITMPLALHNLFCGLQTTLRRTYSEKNFCN